MEALWQDFRYGLRTLTKNPSFTIVGVLTLALGIGANTAIFSAVHAVLIQDLPYQDPDRLVMLWETNREQGRNRVPVSYPNLRDWQEQSDVFEDVQGLVTQPMFNVNLTGVGEPERIPVMRVTPGFFQLFGIQPYLGRNFLPEENKVGNHRVAILSYGLWMRKFSGNEEIVGEKITLNTFPYTVVGVMPPGYRPLGKVALGEEVELWRPIAPGEQQLEMRNWRSLRVFGRLRPGISPEQAQAELDVVARRLEEEYAEANRGRGVYLVPLHEEVVRSIQPALLTLLGAAGLVLLIACANVAGLLLARATTREKEFAIRAALGGGRLRLVRQLLTESVLLGGAGGLAGLLLAYWSLPVLIALGPEELQRVRHIEIDGGVLAFAFGVSFLTSVFFGLAPAMQSSRPDLQETLKEGGRSGQATIRHRLRSTLVAGEVALALILLVGAGLLIRSFGELLQVHPGFRTEKLLTIQLELPMSRYARPNEDWTFPVFHQELQRRVNAIPGVRSSSLISTAPLDSSGWTGRYQVEGRPELPAEQLPLTAVRMVYTDYFRTMGIPLLQGRTFDSNHTKDSPLVVVINDALARQAFPDEDPVGKKLVTTQGQRGTLEIIGVVGNVHHAGLDSEPTPTLYWFALQMGGTNFMTFLVHTEGEPRAVLGAIREEIHAMDPTQPIYNIRTMEETLARSVAPRRFAMLLLGIFAGLALALSAIGIYGLISYMVSQRTHEIGIRMALGARAADILKIIVGRGLALAVAGLVPGVLGALLLTRLLESQLFAVSPTDPVTFAGISLLLLVVALGACILPARRATRVDPMVALRYE